MARAVEAADTCSTDAAAGSACATVGLDRGDAVGAAATLAAVTGCATLAAATDSAVESCAALTADAAVAARVTRRTAACTAANRNRVAI